MYALRFVIQLIFNIDIQYWYSIFYLHWNQSHDIIDNKYVVKWTEYVVGS